MEKTEERVMELAQVITDVVNVQSKDKESFKKTILTVGHMNGSIFNPMKTFNHSTLTFIRLLLSLAAYMGDKEFEKMMRNFTTKLLAIADSDDFDAINAAHARVKTKAGGTVTRRKEGGR